MDVDYKKVGNWLQERRKLNEDWPKKYKALKLKQLDLHTKQLHYLECEKHLDMLKASDEGQSKNLFGGYSSKKIGQWQALLKLFSKDNLHILDLGKALIQYLQYDIPGLKKQMLGIDQQIQSNQMKIQECHSQIIQNNANYQSQCQKLGIVGENIENEVPLMITQIPALFEDINALVHNNKTIGQCIEYYREFSQYTNPHIQQDSITPNLYILYISGNEVAAAQDWEIIQEDKPVEIDWQKYLLPTQVTIADSKLMNLKYRNDVLADLVELQCFYQARIVNASKHTQNALLDAFENSKLFEITTAQLNEFQNYVSNIIALLTSAKLRQLLILKDSNKIQQRIITTLETYKQQNQRSEFNIKTSETKVRDLQEEKEKCQNEYERTQKDVQQVKQYLEKTMKESFKCDIRIVGDPIF